jgi:hypothetical protein
MEDETRILESVLTDYFHAASPRASFARDLEMKLAAAHPDALPSFPEFRNSTIRLRLALVGILLALALAVGLIGGDRVWAAFQQFWQRYIPGIGLVEETSTLVLTHPVAHTEAGVTFEVREFVATQKDTRMTIVVRGLPEGSSFAPDSISVDWPGGTRIRLHTASYAPLWEDCEGSLCQGADEPNGLGLGYVLAPLPAGISTARVTWNIAGLVPGMEWTDRWVLEIPLSPLAQSEDVESAQLIYSVDSSLSIDDFILTVTNVVQAADRTVLDVTWSMPSWEAVAQPDDMALVDDQGRRYALLPGPMDLDEYSQDALAIATESSGAHRYLRHERWQFEPVPLDVNRLNLEIKSAHPRAKADGSFEFDLPLHPQAGDVVPINQAFEVAGGRLRVASVRFVRGTVVIDSRDAPPGSRDDLLLIEVDLDIVKQPPNAHYVDLSLDAGWTAPYWMHPDPPYSESSGMMITRLVHDPDRIWSNHVRMHFGEVTIAREGPWVLGWDVPR